jgi:hypothetical protein
LTESTSQIINPSMPVHKILFKYPVGRKDLDLNAQKLHAYCLKMIASIIIDGFC